MFSLACLHRAVSANQRSALILGLAILWTSGCGRSTTPPFAAERIELKHTTDGQTYFVVDDGNAYREVEPGKTWEYFSTVYDPEEVRKAYVEESGVTYRIAPDTQQRFEVRREIRETFEDLPTGIAGLQAIIDQDRRLWGSFTLQSPQAPSVAEYVALRTELLEGRSRFRDCSVMPTHEKAYEGKTSLQCMAPAKPADMVTCKASISSPIIYFRNGDDFWFEAYFWAEKCLPLTLADLESEFVPEHVGIRIRIFDDESLGIELKALDKPQFRQPSVSRITFPKGEWVRVKAHFFLSPTDGRMEVWQNNTKVLDERGMTLPFRSAIYNSLEVGISAHSHASQPCILYIDNLRVSASDFPTPPDDGSTE